MKKNLLLLTILFCLVKEQASSQCSFTSPTIVQTNAVTVGPNCQLTFTVSFDIDYNGGFKKLYLHIWENTDYNVWHIPANNLYATNSSQPEFNDGVSDPLNILQDALFTVAMDVSSTTITFLPSYTPDPDAPLATGTVVSTIISGTNYHVDISGVTITVPSASLPFGCSNLNLYNGDSWGSQSNSPNPVVHCAQQNLTLLPVKLTSFDAVRNGQNVNLAWQTASEQNNKGFDIERLIGNSGWQKIGFVASQAKAGGSNNNLEYQFTDINNIELGVSQYRLKQIDFDGRSTFSNIRAVNGRDQKGKTIVFPNPSYDGKMNVLFDDANVVRNISLVDINGRTIKQWKGVTNNNIQMENLNAGFYTLRIVNTKTNKQTIEKFVVNKR